MIGQRSRRRAEEPAGRTQVGAGKRGPVTKAIQEQFFGITSGNLPDKYGWLTPVKVGAVDSGD